MTARLLYLLIAVALVAVVTSAAVGYAGARQNPRPPGSAFVTPSRDEGEDPLRPRLFEQNAPIRIHVTGAVKKPGVYSLPSWARVADALKKAGGAAPEANLDAINLADFLRDGEQLRIPSLFTAPSGTHPPAPQPAAPDPGAGGLSPGRYPFSGQSGPASSR